MPAASRQFNLDDVVWFVDVNDTSLRTGTVLSCAIHIFSTLSGTETRVAYKIYDGDTYYTVAQEHIGIDAAEASAILQGLLDSYEC